MTAPIQGQQFDHEEEKLLQEAAVYWRTVWNEALVQAITRIEDAAKQMIMVTTGLQGLYIAIFALSAIRAQVIATLGEVLGVFLLLLFLLPVVCWLVSLFYATRVFIPHVQPEVNFNEVSASAWRKVKDVYGHVSEEKLRFLRSSHRWFIASFVLVLLSILLLILFPPAPTGATPIIATPLRAVMPSP